jgi:hypothetical protein
VSSLTALAPFGGREEPKPDEANVESLTLVWSATTCDFPGAGLYLGLAPVTEHVLVARGLTSRQARLYIGGITAVREGELWALNYIAIRDPSAVKVKPLDKPPLPNGFRHVSLVFQVERAGRSDSAGAMHENLESALHAVTSDNTVVPGWGAFIVTIGLSPGKEARFFADWIASHPRQSWGDLYLRLRDEGCREASEQP